MSIPFRQIADLLAHSAAIGSDAPRTDAQALAACRRVHAAAVAIAFRKGLVAPLFQTVLDAFDLAMEHHDFARQWARAVSLGFRPWRRAFARRGVHRLSDFSADADRLSRSCFTYAHGNCHLLAIALHRMTGLALEASLVDDPDLDGQTRLEHAWVSWDDRFALDIHGLVDKRILPTHYVDLDPDEIASVDETMLIRLGEGDEAAPEDVSAMLLLAIPAALDALSLATRMAHAIGIGLSEGALRTLLNAEHADERIGVCAVTEKRILVHEAFA